MQGSWDASSGPTKDSRFRTTVWSQWLVLYGEVSQSYHDALRQVCLCDYYRSEPFQNIDDDGIGSSRRKSAADIT